MRASDGEARISAGLFFHPGNMLTVLMSALTVQRRTNAEEKLKRVTEIVSVITIKTIRAIVERKLGAESNIQTVAVRQIAHVTDGVSANRENVGFIRWIENQLMTGLLHSLPAKIDRVAPALIV